MTVLGLGCPNAQWRLFSDDEERAILDLRPTGILLLAYPDSPLLSEKVAQEVHLWGELGRPKVLLRPYAQNILDKDPIEWARVCASLWSKYADYGIDAEIIPANELNIEGSGGKEDWPRQIKWLKELAFSFRLSSMHRFRLHLPALSPTGYYLAGHSEMEMAHVHELYDVVDCHCYSMADLTDVPVLAGLYGRPVCVTEYNGMNPGDVAEYLGQYEESEGAYWFILSGTEDQRPYWLLGSKYYEAFKAVGHGNGQPMSGNPSDLALRPPHDEGKDDKAMNEYNRGRIWQDYQAVIEGTPMFQKVRAEHPELGDALGPERDYADVRVQFYAGGIVGATVGDWANTWVATTKDGLPLA